MRQSHTLTDAWLLCIFSNLVNNQLTMVFSALADPTRRRIVAQLKQRGEVRVTALARPHRMSLPAFSRHLRVLERARLVERRRRGRLHLIRARPAGLKPAQQWLARYAAGWQFSFDRLDALLRVDPEDESNHER